MTEKKLVWFSLSMVLVAFILVYFVYFEFVREEEENNVIQEDTSEEIVGEDPEEELEQFEEDFEDQEMDENSQGEWLPEDELAGDGQGEEIYDLDDNQEDLLREEEIEEEDNNQEDDEDENENDNNDDDENNDENNDENWEDIRELVDDEDRQDELLAQENQESENLEDYQERPSLLEGELSRQEAAAFMWIYAREILEEEEIEEEQLEENCDFEDEDEIEDNLREWVMYSCGIWVFRGVGWNFYPHWKFLEDQVFTVAIRLLDEQKREEEVQILYSWSWNFFEKDVEIEPENIIKEQKHHQGVYMEKLDDHNWNNAIMIIEFSENVNMGIVVYN